MFQGNKEVAGKWRTCVCSKWHLKHELITFKIEGSLFFLMIKVKEGCSFQAMWSITRQRVLVTKGIIIYHPMAAESGVNQRNNGFVMSSANVTRNQLWMWYPWLELTQDGRYAKGGFWTLKYTSLPFSIVVMGPATNWKTNWPRFQLKDEMRFPMVSKFGMKMKVSE